MAATDSLRLQLGRPAVLAAARNLIAGMVDCLPAPSSSGTGPANQTSATSSAPSGSSAPIAERLWSMLCDRRPLPNFLRALSAALVLLADHELAASTLAARVAPSVRADPYDVVGTGLGAMNGVLHGGASLGVETLIAAARGPQDVPRVAGELLQRGEKIPGFGQFVYRSGDPRVVVLLAWSAAPRRSPGRRYSRSPARPAGSPTPSRPTQAAVRYVPALSTPARLRSSTHDAVAVCYRFVT